MDIQVVSTRILYKMHLYIIIPHFHHYQNAYNFTSFSTVHCKHFLDCTSLAVGTTCISTLKRVARVLKDRLAILRHLVLSSFLRISMMNMNGLCSTERHS